eukprot:10661168-Alexandrium_andersonii.AAC.1
MHSKWERVAEEPEGEAPSDPPRQPQLRGHPPGPSGAQAGRARKSPPAHRGREGPGPSSHRPLR